MSVERKNQYAYLAIAVVAAMVNAFGISIAAGKVPGLREGDATGWLGAMLLAGITVGVPILGTLAAAIRPRLGSAALAADVDRKRAEGVSRRDMVVATTQEVVELAGRAGPASPSRGVDDLIEQAQALEDSGVPVEEMVIQPRRGWKPHAAGAQTPEARG